MTPTSPDLKTVYIHAKCSARPGRARTSAVFTAPAAVTGVSIAGHGPAQYLHADPLDESAGTYAPTDPLHVSKAFPELKRKFFAAVNEASEGELAVNVPAGAVKQADGAATFDPIVITIDYDVFKPKDGIRFAGLDGSGSVRSLRTRMPKL